MTEAITKRPVLDAIVGQKMAFMSRLPLGMDPDKFLVGVTTAVQKNKDLLACEPKSVILAAYDAAEMGISLSPALALGWLIPYGQTCNFQVSYRGLVQKSYQTGGIKHFFAEVVYEGDKFERQFAPKRNLFHAPGEGARTRDTAIGAYAFVEFADGAIDWEFLTTEQIERRRAHSKQPNSLMWSKFWEEGYRKTPIRVLWKRLPLLNAAMERLAEQIGKEVEQEAEEEPAGRIELEQDFVSPGIPGGWGYPASMPIMEPHQKSITPTVENPAAEPPKMPNPTLHDVFFHVDEKVTTFHGNVRKIVADLPKIGAKHNKAHSIWEMHSDRTHELTMLMDTKGMTYAEVDRHGKVIEVEEAEKERLAETKAEPADLFEESQQPIWPKNEAKDKVPF
jgi:recombination protein RecT